MPPRGLFGAGALPTRAPLPVEPQCGACGLFKGCRSPKMPTAGSGAKSILVIGEAPGETEDFQNKPFVGKTGQPLQTTLRKYGVELFKDCWVMNAAACRPPKNDLPPRAVEYCRPNVVNEIKRLNPEKVLLFGGHAVRSLIGWLWRQDPGGVNRWCGWRVPCQKLNAWVAPFWHPSFVLREEEDKKGATPVRLLWERQIEAALALVGRPWREVPNYAKQVQIELDPVRAAAAVKRFTAGSRPVAFDYENSPLKPDAGHAFVHCCALSDGKTTVAFPWHGAVVDAMRKFLRSGVPKIGANIKHETRWSLKAMGVMPRNWAWDTVLNAHILDNRSGVTGVKMQAFALLGQEPWDDGVKAYLEGDGGNGPNRVREVDLTAMLRYCGLDALVEWHLAKKQAKLLGVTL